MPAVADVVKKLRRMSADEAICRVRAFGTHWAEEQLYRAGLDRNPAPRRGAGDAPYFPYPFLPAGGIDGLGARLAREAPVYAAQVRTEADALCRGELSFFGAAFRLDPARIPWTSDPVSGHPWPMRFHTRVDIFSGNIGHGDVKFVWELNRHQYLVTLGKAWRLTGDARYAETALSWLDSWIAANPYKVGINWASALEVAVRGLSWLWAAALLDDAPAFTAQRRHRVRQSLYQHGRYLASHLSFYFSPYNHLIGEATALHAIGSLVPSLDRAAAWRERGWTILCDEVARQFHTDGGTVEQAFGYHHFTLGFYLQSLLIAKTLGQPVPAALTERLAAAWRFAASITRPDGRVPMVGDADEGKALALDQAHLWDFRSYLGVGALVLEDQILAARARPGCSPDIDWMMGAGASMRLAHASEPSSVRAIERLPSSGYVIQRDVAHGHWCLFDVGDIAHGVPEDDEVSAAHGHADLLAFELTVAGRPRLVDPGFLTYNGPVEWHRYFRDTQAHNALVVDDQSQARYRGRLKWSNGSSARLTAGVAGDAFTYVEGVHDAYARGQAPVTHERAIVWARPDVWIILDRLSGQGEHVLDRYFHFAPGSVEQRGASVSTTDADAPNLSVRCLEADADGTLRAGGPEPGDGWIADRYEQKIPGAVFRVRVRRQVPATLCTVCTVEGAGRPAPTVTPLDVRTGGGVRLEWPDGESLLALWPTGNVPIAAADVETDARLTALLLAGETHPPGDGRLHLRQGHGGQVGEASLPVQKALVVQGTRVVYRGRSIFAAGAPANTMLSRQLGVLAPAPWESLI